MACSISLRVGWGFSSNNFAPDMRKPGVQYPHWTALFSIKASCMGCSFSLTPTPLPEGEGRVREIDKVKAKEYAESALKLATCDGPPYYYKVAYDEAVAMLKRLNV